MADTITIDAINTAKKNTKTLLRDTSKEAGLQTNTEKRKYLIFLHQNARQNHNTKDTISASFPYL
jgi:hypothetical protein